MLGEPEDPQDIHVVPLSHDDQFQALMKIRLSNGYKVESTDCRIISEPSQDYAPYALYTAILVKD